MKLFNYRKFYKKDSLSIDDVGDNPLEFFRRWFKDADNSDEIIESFIVPSLINKGIICLQSSRLKIFNNLFFEINSFSDG